MGNNYLVNPFQFSAEREQQLREAAAAEALRASAAEAALAKLQEEHAALIAERDQLAAQAEGVRGSAAT